MYIHSIQLINYKNFTASSFDFDSKINCLVGNNGIGKTNVLDAIYHLSQTKSYFNPISLQNIRHGEDFFLIEGFFNENGQENHIVCSFKKGQKKFSKTTEKFTRNFLNTLVKSPW